LWGALDGTGPALLPKLLTTDQKVGAASAAPLEVPDGVALVIETSGSTGVPKRVALSAAALLASAGASAAALGGSGQWLLALPVHYVAGAQVLVRSIVAGTQPVVLPPGHFDSEVFAAAAATMTGAQRYVSLVPVQLARLLDAEVGVEALRSFDGILVGGQAVTAELRSRAEASGIAITRTYGSSETSGGCVYNGVPLPGVVARSVDGMLELGGPTLADGYLDDPVRSAVSFYVDGGQRWYRTGDLGDIESGQLTVHGRADNVIISGGEKVLLDAVERAVRSVPGLDEAVVVAAESAEWGKVPVVVVAGRPSASLSDVRSAVAEILGRAAAPARVVSVDVIPMLVSGKPDRLAVAALANNA
jgi:O-succinylbenzoic acid--CoA ligase